MLLLSLITTFAGPALFLWLSRGGRLAKTVDQLIVVILVLLVVVLLVPETAAALGWVSLLLVLAGYLLPGILEFLIRRAAETLHLASLSFALIGLILHAGLDGAGLASSGQGSGDGLGLAIILHRFGVGLMLWLVVQPAFGDRIAWLTLVGMAAATVLGFEFSEWLLPLAGEQAILILQAVIIGTIIHSLVHRGHAAGHTH
ncbi:MAG: hypothetical protein SH820_00555 [Xanthomonadales bacterium]|nr:hypothetical protein [Xanthomonadales bacterium]